MAQKIKFKIIKEKFSDLLTKLEDLSKIDDTIKLKIDKENILMYSMLGGAQVMLAFKNYLVNTTEYIQTNDEFEFLIDVIVTSAKKFVKNLHFIKDSDTINFEITYKESQEDDSIMNARALQISGGKLKVNWITGEHYEMRDINKTVLKQRLDKKNRKWSFSIDKSEFNDVKKLSSINSERIINITINNGKVIMSEKAAWELEVGDFDDDRNASLMLNKRFLSCINENLNSIEFSIFESFMLIQDLESNLMLSFEQDFSDD